MKVKSCRFCLAVNIKVFKLGNTAKKNFIENILKQNGFNQKIFESHYICYECQALLDKSYNFIQRVLRAQGILQKMVKSNVITATAFKEIERQKYGISTTLITHVLKNIDIFGNNGDDVASSDQDECTDPIKIQNVEDTIDIEHIQLNNCTGEYEAIDENKITINEFIIKDDIKMETDSSNSFIGESSTAVLTAKITDKVPRKKKPKLELTKNKKKTNVNKNKGTKKEKVTDKLPKEKKPWKRPTLAVSNFILSLSNIGDKRERRNNNKYALNVTKGDSNGDVNSSASSEECSDSSDNDDMYDDEGKLKKNPKNDDYDEDFKPNAFSEESSSASDDYDRYDDSGKPKGKPKRVYPRQCDHCEYEVPAGKVHFSHYLIAHPNTPYPYPRKNKPKYVCQFCGKIFTKYGVHRDHELIHSGIEKQHLCWKCPKKFVSARHLQFHILGAHPKEIFECDYCHKTFKTRSIIRLHIRTHTGEKPFKCHLCGAGFAHRGNVGVHIRSNHQNNKIKKKTKKDKQTRKRKYSSDDSINLLQMKNKKDVKKKKIKRTKGKDKDAPTTPPPVRGADESVGQSLDTN